MKNFLGIASIIFISLSCSKDEPSKISNPLVGDWIIKQATLDGVLRPEWDGTKISFNETEKNNGKYFSQPSIRDSIWSKEGTWKLKETETSRLYKDTEIPVLYSIKSDTLIMAMVLPWSTKQPKCIEGVPCLTVVWGTWLFTLAKQK